MSNIAASFSLLLFLVAGCATQPAQHGIANFGVVDQDTMVCRGGPPGLQGATWLYANGVTNFVKLNTSNEGSDRDALLLGIKIKSFPITTWQQCIGGSNLAKILVEAEREIGPGTYVHCSHGKNRTGTLIAYWRIRECGWTKDQAKAEALHYGWGDSLPGLRRFWRQAQ